MDTIFYIQVKYMVNSEDEIKREKKNKQDFKDTLQCVTQNCSWFNFKKKKPFLVKRYMYRIHTCIPQMTQNKQIHMFSVSLGWFPVLQYLCTISPFSLSCLWLLIQSGARFPLTRLIWGKSAISNKTQTRNLVGKNYHFLHDIRSLAW